MRRFLLFVGLVGVVYLVALVVVASREVNADQLRRSQEEKVAALARSLASSFEQFASFESVAEACKGKLTAGALRSLVVYTLAADGVLPDGSKELRLDGRIVGYSRKYVEVSEPEVLTSPAGLIREMEQLASPDEWGWRGEDREAFIAETRALRYLAVAQFTEAKLASLSLDGKSFDPGRAEYRVQVVSFPDGKPVCAGVGKGRMVSKVIGHGKAKWSFEAEDAAKKDAEKKLEGRWLAATLASPLHELCDAGGEQLCFHAGVMTDAPDW